jgi:hypothetical protein|tara:strand:- start:84 stop:806 length:723 start_codon:yes stop_codon:yes gene_type:complete
MIEKVEDDIDKINSKFSIIGEKSLVMERSLLSEHFILTMPDNEYKGFTWLIGILKDANYSKIIDGVIRIKYSDEIWIILDVERSIKRSIWGVNHLEILIEWIDSNNFENTRMEKICVTSSGIGTASDACTSFVLWAESGFSNNIILDGILSRSILKIKDAKNNLINPNLARQNLRQLRDENLEKLIQMKEEYERIKEDLDVIGWNKLYGRLVELEKIRDLGVETWLIESEIKLIEDIFNY